MRSVLAALDLSVERYPDKLLYSFLDRNGDEIARHTYASFLARVNLIASHLMARTDLQRGDRVLLVYPPGLEMVAALFAGASAGLIPVPVPPPSTHGSTVPFHRMRHIARDCAPTGVLTSREMLAPLRRQYETHGLTADGTTEEMQRVGWIATDDLDDGVQPSCRAELQDVFFLQYTSGSTSSPRGVIVTHDNVLHNCGVVVDHESPIGVSWLPQHHDMGLLGYYIYVALAGGTTYGFAPASFIQRPALWLETISRRHATASSAPNFAFEYCLRPGRIPDATLAALDLSSLRYLMAAAEPINPTTYRAFLRRFEPRGLKPQHFFVAYGLAENTLAVTSYGRSAISVNRQQLAEGIAEPTRDISGVGVAKHLMSCGAPLTDIVVCIVDPGTRIALPDGAIGEIWVRSASTSAGYWNNPALTRDTFGAHLASDDDEETGYLRTGDLGFFANGELHVCGRRKDMIIVHGQNLFPQDIEAMVEDASPLVRHGGVAAFELDGERPAPIGIVAEVVSRGSLPDPRAIAVTVREQLGVGAGLVVLVPPKSVPKTSSGKIMRYMAKHLCLAGELTVLKRYEPDRSTGDAAAVGLASPFALLKRRYALTGHEGHTLIEAGMDSIDLVVFLHELKQLLETRGASLLSQQVDVRLIQRARIVDLFRLVDECERDPDVAIAQFREVLAAAREQFVREERAMMTEDRRLGVGSTPSRISLVRGAPRRARVAARRSLRNAPSVLLTGGTGFLGPFLLRSLLEQSDSPIRVLVRATSENDARTRLRTAFERTLSPCPALDDAFDERVHPVCGDLEQPGLGLARHDREALIHEVETIYHNAATVNYLFDYATMRGANVAGTREMLRFALEGPPKVFNHVSTTFVFGWARKPVLCESDTNAAMDRLDFGYSQTKWVAEQLVLDAARAGLETRIFRPSLITPSMSGGGASVDITIRLLAFMIKHGIGVDTRNQVSFVPAEVTANNIVAIATQPRTAGGIFHVTRDEYANMVDVITIISGSTGRQFELYPLPKFVPEVIQRCTRQDLLYPLLDFLIGSVDNISAMEFKRYDNSSYRAARDMSPYGMRDPSLEETVHGILAFMARTGIE